MKKTVFSEDYKSAVVALVKGKYPALIFGCIVTGFALFFAASTFKFIPFSKHKKIVVKDTLHIAKVQTYTVQPGDDLWSVAQKFYGSGFNAYDIAKANKLEEPYTLSDNQILIIPSAAAKQPTQGEITESAPSTQHISEYVVLQGEYLWQIAEKIYGDGNQMGKLINANNIPYPYNVEAGQKLIVP